MKTLNALIIVIFLSLNINGQNWGNIINTQLNFQVSYYSDAFVNSSGINLVTSGVKDGAEGIRYVLISSTGSILKQVTLDNNGLLPLIVGNNDTLFVVYVKDGSLKVLRSTDLFTSWIDLSPPAVNNVVTIVPNANKYNNSNTESGRFQMFDAAYRDGRLHIVWTETIGGINEAYYDQYYRGRWLHEKEEITSDFIGETGGRPRIALLSTYLIVSYVWLNNNYMGTVRTRYRNIVDPIWTSAVTAFSGNSVGEEISSDDMYIHLFYYQWQQAGGNIPLYHKKMPIGNSNWGTETTLLVNNVDAFNGVKCSKTVNGIFNISYITFQISTPSSANLIHRSFSGNNWSNAFNVSSSLGYTFNFGFSSVSNDMYFVWFNYHNNISTLYYRQYDAVPLAPQNLAVTVSSNNRPLLQWSRNNEADIQHYKIYKYKDPTLGWVHYATTTSTIFEDINETISPIPVANEIWIYYRITAVDYYPNESSHSNQVGIKVIGSPLDKLNIGSGVNEYSLFQNHPNPFNPTTKISWQSPVNGQQTLKVYDVLGREVATLVDEYREAGSYEIEFDATNLPSGMYIYRLQSGSYSDVKKMILSK